MNQRGGVRELTRPRFKMWWLRLHECEPQMPRITPVLTLRHFAALTDLPYMFLRRTVGRRANQRLSVRLP